MTRISICQLVCVFFVSFEGLKDSLQLYSEMCCMFNIPYEMMEASLLAINFGRLEDC